MANTSIPLPCDLVLNFTIPPCVVDVRILRLDLYTFVTRDISMLASTRQRCLVELEAICVALFRAKSLKLCHRLAYIIAHREFAFRSHDLVILLIAQMFPADRIIAHDFPTLGLVLFYFGETYDLWAERALDSEGMDYLFYDSRGASDFYVFVAHWAVFVQD